jgi:hypothetical protein
VVEGSVVYDSMSGASPVFHNTLSGASGKGVTEYRTAGDVKVTRYFERFAVDASAGYSGERDYVSRYGSAGVRAWTADKNTTLSLSVGGAADAIDPVNRTVTDRSRDTLDFQAGVTQALTATDIVSSNLTYSSGHGYYADPYKSFDTRPDRRRVLAWLTRYNRYFPSSDGTLKLAFRWLRDSFGSDSAMVEASWNQPLPQGFSVQPNVRYVTQDAASFYRDPPWPIGFVPGQAYSADTRLAAWGAATIGATLAKSFPGGWSADLKLQYYRQEPGWRLGGSGSPGIKPFMASWYQVGVAKTF